MKKQSRRSRKTRGGYKEAIETKRSRFYPFKKHLYSVEFDDQEEQNIKDYKENNKKATPDKILNELFPEMKQKYRDSKTSDTIYKIQLLLDTAYAGTGERHY